jgi:hypothetical protein
MKTGCHGSLATKDLSCYHSATQYGNNDTDNNFYWSTPVLSPSLPPYLSASRVQAHTHSAPPALRYFVSHDPLSLLHNPLSLLHNPLSLLHNPLSLLHNPLSLLHNPLSLLTRIIINVFSLNVSSLSLCARAHL